VPAATERRRLLELYARGLRVDGVDWEPIRPHRRLQRRLPRELLRQSALHGASDDGEAPRLTEAALVNVLADLSTAAQTMTLRLLGSSP